jgi:hypothetical protein
MTTVYTKTPTFEDRVVASPLVILGRVERVVDVTTDYASEPPQVRTTFRVRIESVLKGQAEDRDIRVQVAGGKADEVETPWSVRLKEGEIALLMLTPNYAHHAPDVFVPYGRSSYPVTQEDDVELSEEVAKQLVEQGIPVNHRTAKLDDLRRLVQKVVRRQEKQETRLVEQEPTELREMPYGEIMEMPQPDAGGARSAAPENQTELTENAN